MQIYLSIICQVNIGAMLFSSNKFNEIKYNFSSQPNECENVPTAVRSAVPLVVHCRRKFITWREIDIPIMLKSLSFVADRNQELSHKKKIMIFI